MENGLNYISLLLSHCLCLLVCATECVYWCVYDFNNLIFTFTERFSIKSIKWSLLFLVTMQYTLFCSFGNRIKSTWININFIYRIRKHLCDKKKERKRFWSYLSFQCISLLYLFCIVEFWLEVYIVFFIIILLSQ